MKLSDFKVLTFDCYGTLIDWESGMIAGLAPLTARVGRRLARDEILEAHARHEFGAATADAHAGATPSCWRSSIAASPKSGA